MNILKPVAAESYRFGMTARSLLWVLAFAMVGGLMYLSPWRSLERSWGLDMLYTLRGVRPSPPEVMVVAINTKAAQALKLPMRPDRWSRTFHAELIERLHRSGATAIGLDLFFDRPKEGDEDAVLARALRSAGNVVLVAYLQRQTQIAGRTSVSVDRLLQPLPSLAQAAAATAPFALVKSSEGALEYLAFAPEGDDTPSLPLVLTSLHRPEALHPLNAAMITVPGSITPAAQLEQLRRWALAQPASMTAHASKAAPQTALWLDRLTQASPITTLNLYGPPGQVRTLGYDRALTLLRSGGLDAQVFRNKVVLVGLSEFDQPEQRDMHRTPWSTSDGLDISGVELAATAVANQLDGSWLKRRSVREELAVVMVLAALMMAPWRWLAIRRALLVSATVALGYAIVAQGLFQQQHVWLPVAIPLFILWPLSLLMGLGLHLRQAERQRVRLRIALDRYGPREEVARIAAQLGRQDDVVHVACLSTDIEDYTRRIEGREPGQARRWLNAYFEIVFPIVRQHGGHVVDHAGDAMVCIWLSGKDVQAACQAAADTALALSARLNPPGLGDTADFDPDAYRTRIGVHFGPVSLGQVGDAQHAEQRVVGDIVNTTSRIQSANKPLGTRCLISDAIAHHLPTDQFRYLGHFLLSGKSHPIGLCAPGQVDPELATWHQQALQAWHDGDRTLSGALVNHLLERWPHDGPALFLQAQLTAPPHPSEHAPPLGDETLFKLSLK